MSIQIRRNLLLNAWLQLALLVLIAILANVVAARHFARVDLTRDRVYTLSEPSRELVGSLDRVLQVKVYFSRGLEAPYNNHEAILVDKLEEFRAYAKGRMDLTVVDPTGDKPLEEEANKLGIQPIQYRYQGKDRAELKRVYMGVAFVYGDKQTAIEAMTRVDMVEYEIARAIRLLLSDEPKKTLGLSTGSQEVDLLKGTGPLEVLRDKLQENYKLVSVPLGGQEGVPADVNALLVIGPQAQMSERARYQLDQFLLRGGSLALFLTRVKPDMRTFRAEEIFTGLEGLLAHHGVVLNRDIVLDRNQNGMMRFPVRQGRHTVQIPVNYPLIPRATDLAEDSLVLKGLEQMLFPFASSLDLVSPLPSGVEARILARASPGAARLRGLRTIDPISFKSAVPGEEQGPWPLMVSLTGTFTSFFAGRQVPTPIVDTPLGPAPVDVGDESATRIDEGAPARLVVAGSADVAANNTAFMLNLVDWMCQDEALIGIRARNVQLPPLARPEGARLAWIKIANALGGTLLLLLFGVLRWALRRRSGDTEESP